MSWPICILCHTECSSIDSFGLCPRISITHDAVRHPEEYPRDKHPELWELILSGRPVFPLTPREAARLKPRRPQLAA